ncbi:MAG: GNAT family N-acetyltransferase [Saccharofermentanales bacterium]
MCFNWLFRKTIKRYDEEISRKNTEIESLYLEINNLKKCVARNLNYANNLLELNSTKGSIVYVAEDKNKTLCYVTDDSKELSLFIANSFNRCGYLCYQDIQNTKDIKLVDIVIDKSHRNIGRGSILMNSLIKITEQKEKTKIIGALSPIDEEDEKDKNLRDGFYRKHGFSFVDKNNNKQIELDLAKRLTAKI